MPKQNSHSRDISVPQMFFVTLFLFSLVFLITVADTTLRDRSERRQLVDSGLATQAIVANREIRVRHIGSSDTRRHFRTETSRCITYEFTSGQSQYRRTICDHQTYSSLEIGDPVDIIYAPDNPAVSRLQSHFREPDPADFYQIYVAAGILVVLTIIWAIYGLFLRLRRS
jgi:hypothetical protein